MKLALTKLLFETGRKGLFLIVSLFFTIWTSSAHGQAGLTAQTDPKNLYDQMIQSRKNYNYSGIFTYEQGGQLQSYSVESSLLDGFIEKKMEPLNGPENTHQMSFESACEQTQNPNSEQLSSYYNFYTRSETRIAGINGIEIVLAPVDKYRHGYQYVIDPLTGLMLRSVILTPDRRMIERLQYVQLDYQPSYESSNYASLEAFSNAFEDASEQADLVDDASLPVQKALVTETAEDQNQAIEKTIDQTIAAEKQRVLCDLLSIDNGWAAGWIPDGFSIIDTKLDDDRAILIYGDGIAAFSVFIEPVLESF